MPIHSVCKSHAVRPRPDAPDSPPEPRPAGHGPASSRLPQRTWCRMPPAQRPRSGHARISTVMLPDYEAPILSWYAVHARDLPWRRADASPWSILVSEVMLQQTPVARVLPAHAAWMTRWPSPPHWRLPLPLTRSANGTGSATRAGPCGCTRPRRSSLTSTMARSRRRPPAWPGCRASAPTRPRQSRASRSGAQCRAGHERAAGARPPGRRRGAAAPRRLGRGAQAGGLAAAGLRPPGCPLVGRRDGTGRAGLPGARPLCSACPVAADCAWRRSGSPGGPARRAVAGLCRQRPRMPRPAAGDPESRRRPGPGCRARGCLGRLRAASACARCPDRGWPGRRAA